MYVREEMPVEAVLKGSAAKVLLHLLRRNGDVGTNAEMMRGSGVHDRNTYYVARSQLQDLGLWENPYSIFQQVQGITQQGGGKNPAPLMENPAPPVASTPVTITPLEPANAPDDDLSRYLNELPLESAIPEPRNYLAEAGEADRMPGSGEAHQRTSAFQERRHQQIAVLRDAWKELFGAEATPDTIKSMLVLTDNFAEDVLDMMEKAKARNVESPRGYIMVALRNKQQELSRRVIPGHAGGLSVGPASGSGQGERGWDESPSTTDDNYYLKEPTPQTKKIRDQIAKAVASGRLKLLEDDDDD